jgi:recombinational DNA repair protein RecT
MNQALVLTKSALDAPPKLADVFELDAFRQNCISNYQKTTGLTNGSIIFERERVAFFKTIQENPKLEQCTRISIYSAFVELFASGRTLNEGDSYIIPYGAVAQFQIGWKGRLEQISQMPEIKFVNHPQIVWNSEVQRGDFDYELGESPRIVKHKPNPKAEKDPNDFITHVYLILDTHFGKKTYLMTREEVLNIRDNYSPGYRSYITEIKKQGLKVGDKVVKKGTGKNGPYEFTIEPPFWVTSEAKAFKKTLVKQVYGFLPKTPRLKAIDARIAANYDKEDGSISETHDIDYGLADDAKQLPAETLQQTPPAPPAEEKKKKVPAEKKTKAPENKDVQSKTKIVNLNGDNVDTGTGEVMDQDGPADDNPALDLPDLSSLNG